MKLSITILTLFMATYLIGQPEIDCVYSTDYKVLTLSTLEDLDKEGFVWSAETNKAELHSENDTLAIKIGGCVHYGMMVEVRLGNDQHAIEDSGYWLKKAHDLASDFKFDHYVEMIEENHTKRSDTNDDIVWFEVPDDDVDDSLHYNGIKIDLIKKSKIIRLYKYLN